MKEHHFNIVIFVSSTCIMISFFFIEGSQACASAIMDFVENSNLSTLSEEGNKYIYFFENLSTLEKAIVCRLSMQCSSPIKECYLIVTHTMWYDVTCK